MDRLLTILIEKEFGIAPDCIYLGPFSNVRCTFPSREARERVLYANFLRVNQDIKDMIREIQQYKVKK